MDIEGFKKSYSANDVARAFCDHMASRQRNQSETKLRRISGLLKNDGFEVKKSELINVFRKLEEFGCGQYVEGRHGWPSRFVWKVDSLSACRAASGETSVVKPLPEVGDESASDVDMLTHTFNLRADLPIDFSLPIDLTTLEAGRLANFIKALPLEEYD